MKKLIMVIAILFAFSSMAVADTVSGNPGDTLTLTKDIKLNVLSNYNMAVVSLQVQGDGNVYGTEDLGGAWDFGTLDPSVILADNPYGSGLRIGSSHYMDVRIYVSNNANPYHVDLSYTGSISNLPPTDGSSPDDFAIHFATFDINTFVSDQHTQNPDNLSYVANSPGSNATTGLFPLLPNTTYTLYNTDEILSDAFAMLVFVDNVNPNFNASSIDPEGDGIVGSVTYSMVPNL